MTYPALRSVLDHFVGGVRDLLAGNFIAAYLQGSFALGGYDEHSDADFIVVVREDVAAARVPALDALHASIHDFPAPWGHRLEGSYVPVGVLRRLPGDPPEQLLYLDHGARSLVRSDHDDTCVCRWVTREKAIVLAGPDPRDLVSPVPAAALRREMQRNFADWPRLWFPGDHSIGQQWKQALIVVSYCRMLHTLETGMVGSKPAAAEWALHTLDRRWHRLIATSLRARPSQSLGLADPGLVAETLAFVAAVTPRA